MNNPQQIAFQIKQSAKEKNITVKQLLENCGLNINTISELSKGKQISYVNFANIADYLAVSVDYLLGRTDNPSFRWFESSWFNHKKARHFADISHCAVL